MDELDECPLNTFAPRIYQVGSLDEVADWANGEPAPRHGVTYDETYLLYLGPPTCHFYLIHEAFSLRIRGAPADGAAIAGLLSEMFAEAARGNTPSKLFARKSPTPN